ncbi:hypothetical protein KT71_08345, partial [Congregibacter litoralis KT71]
MLYLDAASTPGSSIAKKDLGDWLFDDPGAEASCRRTTLLELSRLGWG